MNVNRIRPDRQRFAIVVEPRGPDERSALKSWLKVGWRRFSIKCVSIGEAEDGRASLAAARDEAGVVDG